MFASEEKNLFLVGDYNFRFSHILPAWDIRIHWPHYPGWAWGSCGHGQGIWGIQ